VGPDVVEGIGTAPAEDLREAAVALVCGELTEPGGLRWFRRAGERWREEPRSPDVRLARGGEGTA
jgi:hypothetical protein